MKPVDDREFLEQRIKDLEASVAYFAPENKKTRELWVAQSFLENLGIPFSRDEIVTPDDDPPDVAFRDARFEVKEVLDPGRRQHQEYKQELARARELTNPRDLLEMFTPKTIAVEAIHQLCRAYLESIERKYPLSVRASLDLLFYVNIKHVMSVIEKPFPDTSELAGFGWRSVSFVNGQRSCCLYASTLAPSFIHAACGKISHLHPW